MKTPEAHAELIFTEYGRKFSCPACNCTYMYIVPYLYRLWVGGGGGEGSFFK